MAFGMAWSAGDEGIIQPKAPLGSLFIVIYDTYLYVLHTAELLKSETATNRIDCDCSLFFFPCKDLSSK